MSGRLSQFVRPCPRSLGDALLFRYWQTWIERRKLARLDADRLMEEFGPAAYEVAWTMAQEVDSGTLIDTRPEGHWDRVRNIIARRTYRPFWSRSDPLQ
jgi:hypothetical protein